MKAGNNKCQHFEIVHKLYSISEMKFTVESVVQNTFLLLERCAVYISNLFQKGLYRYSLQLAPLSHFLFKKFPEYKVGLHFMKPVLIT